MLEQVEQGRPLGVVAPARSSCDSADMIAQPLSPLNISSNQPSRMEQLSAPLSAAFIAAGPARLLGPSGRVEPHVGTLVQHPGDGHVVVLEERHPRAAARDPGTPETMALIISLPRSSAGWAFPANTICTGRSGSVSSRLQAVGLGEQQRGPLVGGEPARPAERQGRRVEDLVDPVDVGLAARHGRTLASRSRTKVDEPLPAQGAYPPQLVGGRVGEVVPAVGAGLRPFGQDAAFEQLVELLADPGAGVDPVGDGSDRHLVGRHVGPERAEHAAAHRRRAAWRRRWPSPTGAARGSPC